MLGKIISIYAFFFARPFFKKFNKFLHRLALSGLGILNYKSTVASGERAFLGEFLKNKTGVVIDVGANQGNYSLEALGFNPSIRIYAFEPHPITFEVLSKKVGKRPNIMPINMGMSARPGKLHLFDYPSKDGSSHASLFQDVITELHGAGSAVSHEVALTTLDDFVSSQEISEITLLKIDTEGNELEVLRGGVNLITQGKIKAIHFEFNEMNVSSRAFFRDFWKLLENYRFYRLLPNHMLEIKNYSPLSCEIFAYQNIVAILKD